MPAVVDVQHDSNEPPMSRSPRRPPLTFSAGVGAFFFDGVIFCPRKPYLRRKVHGSVKIL